MAGKEEVFPGGDGPPGDGIEGSTNGRRRGTCLRWAIFNWMLSGQKESPLEDIKFWVADVALANAKIGGLGENSGLNHAFMSCAVAGCEAACAMSNLRDKSYFVVVALQTVAGERNIDDCARMGDQ